MEFEGKWGKKSEYQLTPLKSLRYTRIWNPRTEIPNYAPVYHNVLPKYHSSQSLKVGKSTDSYDSIKVASGSKSMYSQFCQMTQYSIFSREPLTDKSSNSAFLETYKL